MGGRCSRSRSTGVVGIFPDDAACRVVFHRRFSYETVGGATVTDEAMLAAALHQCGQEMSLCGSAARLVIATGQQKGQYPPIPRRPP
jgi:hypothetical protein